MYAWFSVIPVLGAATGNEPDHLQRNTAEVKEKKIYGQQGRMSLLELIKELHKTAFYRFIKRFQELSF